MSGDFRANFIRQINIDFGPANIANTAARLANLRRRGDMLQILHQLGILAIVTRQSLRAYRRELAIPKLNQKILTDAFREALFGRGGPTPLRFQIWSGRQEAIEVTVTARQISVVLIRIDPPNLQRPRPPSKR
jgi:hypothetical protein